MDWDKLRVFHAVAEAGSFTHAGEILNLSQSSVSRQVSSLEQSLNVPLFHRHARGLKLTETGETLYATAKDVFAKVAIAAKRHPPMILVSKLAFIGSGSAVEVGRRRSYRDLAGDQVSRQ